jgi:sarcosine oxidase subunit beta
VTTSPATLESSRRSVAVQQSLGVRSEILKPGDLKAFLAQLVTEDLVGASFCADDGSADPYGLLQAFLALARGRGLVLRTATPVTGIQTAGGRVTGVSTPAGAFAAPVVIDCAGPHADEVAALAGLDVPSKPYRRQVMVTERVAGFPDVFPMIIDLDTGWYVHSQRSALLMGGTDKDQHPGHDTTVDWAAFSLVFEAAARRVPPLAEARVMRAYAGVRDLTPDYHGILCESDVRGFYLACGFSGHGFMHSPAIGTLMAELVLDGRATSMDIAPLALSRFARGVASAEATMF